MMPRSEFTASIIDPIDKPNMAYRRRHFLINKPLQFRYMAYLTATLLVIAVISLLSLYIGVWGGVLDAFSDKRIRDDLLIASRLTQYEDARIAAATGEFSTLSFFKQSEKLSQRQREVFKEILTKTNRELFLKLLLLFVFIGWGSIYVSHKVAGPLYRFSSTLTELIHGNLATRIHLRKGDEAQFIAEQFNEALLTLDLKFSQLKNIVQEHEKNPERLTARLNEELAKIKTSADL